MLCASSLICGYCGCVYTSNLCVWFCACVQFYGFTLCAYACILCLCMCSYVLLHLCVCGLFMYICYVIYVPSYVIFCVFICHVAMCEHMHVCMHVCEGKKRKRKRECCRRHCRRRRRKTLQSHAHVEMRKRRMIIHSCSVKQPLMISKRRRFEGDTSGKAWCNFCFDDM